MLTIPISTLHDWKANLPEDLQSAIALKSRLRKVPAGGTLYSFGDTPNELYTIVCGQLTVLNYTEDGRESIITELHSGDCAGIMGAIDGLPRGNTAIAKADTVVSVLSRVDFLHFFNSHIEVAQQLTLMLCSRYRMVTCWREEASCLTLTQKLIRLLIRQSYANGQHFTDGSVEILNSSHDSLSKMLGATRQSISRELKSLKQSGLVEMSYRRIKILDLKKLEEHVDEMVGMVTGVAEYKSGA